MCECVTGAQPSYAIKCTISYAIYAIGCLLLYIYKSGGRNTATKLESNRLGFMLARSLINQSREREIEIDGGRIRICDVFVIEA